ncbi:hypothetical protein MKW94_004881 [Papaver nudicaule]|uniref:Peroxidase n=1 Tax=Papaver nudicaule TaxID=74823 RepID=A0AA41SH35_PAPNU|nr:hypothetical protein [Papaver nudicaule]MCL7034492.1 hypothetical protein [Papaver nudicaule]
MRIESTSPSLVTFSLFVLVGTLSIEFCNGDLGSFASSVMKPGKAKGQGKDHKEDDPKNLGGLKMKFYESSCPNVDVEKIVETITWKHAGANPSLGAKLLRMHFHDCFVRGCDASILLDPSTKKDSPQVEKQSPPNLSVSGYEVIDEIKTRLEKECRATVVSCADIIALATRDAVSFQFQKRMWEVPLGRRDGRISRASDALDNLPSPSSNFQILRDAFAAKNLDTRDLVALSGAHTLGVTQCGMIATRLFNFTGRGDTDPSIQPAYANTLKAKCRGSFGTVLEMDPDGNSKFFDSHYYKILNQKKGIFESDAALLTDSFSASIVKEFEDDTKFFAAFATSMVKLGGTNVLTGKNEGEIRRQCRFVN